MMILMMMLMMMMMMMMMMMCMMDQLTPLLSAMPGLHVSQEICRKRTLREVSSE